MLVSSRVGALHFHSYENATLYIKCSDIPSVSYLIFWCAAFHQTRFQCLTRMSNHLVERYLDRTPPRLAAESEDHHAYHEAVVVPTYSTCMYVLAVVIADLGVARTTRHAALSYNNFSAKNMRSSMR